MFILPISSVVGIKGTMLTGKRLVMSSELWNNKRIKHIKAHSGYSKHLLPSETLNCLLPGHTFLKGTYYYTKSSRQQKFALEKLFWGTDPLGTPDSWPYNV